MTVLQTDYLELRPLPKEDLPMLLKVYQDAPLYFGSLGDDAGLLSFAEVRTQWEAARATPGRVLLGIYQHAPNVLVGVADVQTGAPQPGAAAILLLLIGSGFQHQGYGQDCMGLLQEWLAAEHDIESLWAVATDDESGLRFLRNQGFETAEQPAVPPIGVGRAFWMRRAAYQ